MRIAPIFTLLMLLVASFCLFSGCGREGHDPRLISCQANIDRNPDSVRRVLSSYDSGIFRESDRAFYHLLMVQCLDKTNDLESDTIHVHAVFDYYKDKGSDSEKMKTFFYKGRYLFYKNSYEEAANYGLVAYDYANELKDNFWIAKTAELLADIFSETYLSEDALKYRKIALDNYRIDDQLGNYEYTLCDYASELIYTDRIGEGVTISDSIFKTALDKSDYVLAEYAGNILLDGHYRNGARHSLDSIYNQLTQLPGYAPTSYVYSLLAWSAAGSENRDSVLAFLKAAESVSSDRIDKVSILYELKNYYKNKGDLGLAIEMADSLYHIQNSVLTDLMKQPAIKAQRDFFSKEAERQSRKVASRTVVIILLGIVFVILLLFGVYYLRSRINIKNLEIEMQLAEVTRLQNDINGLSASITGLHSEIESLFRSKFSTIGMLAKEYLDRWECPVARHTLLDRIEEQIDNWKTEGKLREIESALNNYSNHAVERLRCQFPKLKERDINVLMFLWAGLPVKAVALFCGINHKTIYTKRRRLIEKFKASDAPDKEDFIRLTEGDE